MAKCKPNCCCGRHNRVVSPETGIKIGNAKRGVKQRPEVVNARRLKQLGKKPTPESNRKRSETLKGRKWSEQQRKNSEGRRHSEETKRKIGDGNRGKTRSPETKLSISKKLKGRKIGPASPEAIANMKLAWKSRAPYPPEFGKKISKALKGKKLAKKRPGRKASSEQKRKQSESMKIRWLDPRYRSKIEQKRKNSGFFKLGASHVPNKLERRVEAYLNAHFPGQWRFNTGDFVISGFVPDFIHANNLAVLEVFGDYWHRNENPQKRITIYRQCGFNSKVIWEHEFNANPNTLKVLIEDLQCNQKS